MGNEFKDQLIPLALEYYLEVIEPGEEDDHECDSCDEEGGDEHHHGANDKDSEEEVKPKVGKKKGGNK